MYRTITAETTDEQISAPVESAKKGMLNSALEAQDSEFHFGERFLRAAQQVRNAEAVASAATLYRNTLRNTSDKMKAMETLMGILSRGADDAWSGRENDSARAAHDAVRTFVTQMADNLKYGE